MKKEIFKPLTDYEGKYLISSHGRIFNIHTHKFINLHMSNRGYLLACLYDNKTKKSVTVNVHRLVADKFIPNPDNLSDCNHIDEDKTNNNVENLQWVSHKDNCNYGERNRKISSTHKGKPRDGRPPRPVINLDTGEYYESLKEASEKTGVHTGVIFNSCNRTYTRKHKHNWSYVYEK